MLGAALRFPGRCEPPAALDLFRSFKKLRLTFSPIIYANAVGI
jgi:hypothetical protein